MKVLLINQNNGTSDNVLNRLLEHQKLFLKEDQVHFCKITSTSHIESPNIKPYSSSCSRFSSIKKLERFIEKTDVFVANVFSQQNTFLQCIKFDICFINEASLMVEPVSIIPIINSKKFIMIGDYY